MNKQFSSQRITNCANYLLGVVQKHGLSKDGFINGVSSAWEGEASEAAVFEKLGIAHGGELTVAWQALVEIKRDGRVDLSSVDGVMILVGAGNTYETFVFAGRMKVKS